VLAPSIKFTQGVTVGTPNVALMGVLTTSVTAQANTADGSKRWVFSWIDAPPTSAITRAQAVQDSGSVSALTFSPDVAGCYCLQLDSYDANGARATVYLCFGVLNAHGRLPSFPAMVPFAGFPEITAYQCMNFSGGTRGYAPYVEAYNAAVDAGGAGGNALQLQGVDISNVAPTNGQALVYVNGTTKWTPTSPTGSLGGTYLTPTVVAIDGAAGTVPVNCAAMTWADAAGAPVIGQGAHASGTSAVMTVESQQSSSGSAGGLVLRGGKGSVAGGNVDIQVAATTTYAVIGRFTSAGFFPGTSWHSFQNGFIEIGAVGGVTVPNTGTVRLVNNGSLQSFTGGAPGTGLSLLSWSGTTITLGNASNASSLSLQVAGDLTFTPSGKAVIQSATKWMKGGVSHAGWTFSDQADPQLTNNTPTAVYTFATNNGSNYCKAKIVGTRNDQAAAFAQELKYAALNNAGTLSDLAVVSTLSGPDSVSTGSTITATMGRSGTNVVVTITSNAAETWNFHVEFEATIQP